MYIDNYINPKPQRSLLYGEKSMGIVVKTPEELEKDNVVGVYIPRFMFGLENANGAYETDVTVDNKILLNSMNKKIGATKFKSKNYIILPIAQNGCIMSSRLVKGENVFIECCDRDIKNLYAKPFTLGEQVKRKDDVFTILVPNLKKWDEASALNLDNSYGIQIDTRNKILSLWTTCEGGGETGDNEKGKYMISINSKEGKLLISDNGKRTWTLNTDEDSITALNEAGSKIEMIKDTINVYAPSTINIEAKNEIHLKSSKLTREFETINTTCTNTDTEDTKTLDIHGTKLISNYKTTSIESESYENKTSKWKTDSPISGFTKILTANSFNISPNAGINPSPTAPTFTSSGQLKCGNPSAASIPAVLFAPTSTVLSAIATKLDEVCSIVGCPKTSETALLAWATTGASKWLFG